MNIKLLATALMVASVSACEQANRLEETLTGKPALVADPVPLLDIPDPIVEPAPEPVVETPASVAEVPAPPVVVPEPEPAPLQWGDAGYECVPVFRVLSCDDDGRPHQLDSNGNWVN